ncbi:MAG: flagellar hook-basal body complex protein FliE [Deltaproteobacteria bacterium]|nr:flagellar hook-basal body complex protein FliE [Deltaproteobacteria bacterium]HEN21118.1 flagellar hook-basal body complex protein FliE [Desulfobacteraceae bacterium]
MKEITLQTDLKALFDSQIKEKPVQLEGGKSFSEMLKNSIGEVNRLQEEADVAVKDLAAGKGKDIHETMIALEKASVSFQMMMQVRNKIIGAYEEIMRMQV